MAIKRPEPKTGDVSVDKWVESRSVEEPEVARPAHSAGEQDKRFTVIVPESLHQEMKVFCVQRNISLKDFVIRAVQNEMQH